MNTYSGLTQMTGAMPPKTAGILEDAYRKSFMPQLVSGTQDAGRNIAAWYQGLPEETRNAIIRGGVGALAGATLGGGMNYFANRGRPEGERTSPLSPMLLAALLGGGAAAALPAGLKMLTGQTRFPGETSPSPASKAISGALSPLSLAPLTTAGGVAGALYKAKYQPLINEALKAVRDDAGKLVVPRYANPAFSRKGFIERIKPSNLLASTKGKLKAGFGMGERSAINYRNMESAAKGLYSGIKKNPRLLMRRTHGGRMGMVAVPIGLALGGLADLYMKGKVK